jgi:hypothetical protein
MAPVPVGRPAPWLLHAMMSNLHASPLSRPRPGQSTPTHQHVRRVSRVGWCLTIVSRTSVIPPPMGSSGCARGMAPCRSIPLPSRLCMSSTAGPVVSSHGTTRRACLPCTIQPPLWRQQRHGWCARHTHLMTGIRGRRRSSCGAACGRQGERDSRTPRMIDLRPCHLSVPFLCENHKKVFQIC